VSVTGWTVRPSPTPEAGGEHGQLPKEATDQSGRKVAMIRYQCEHEKHNPTGRRQIKAILNIEQGQKKTENGLLGLLKTLQTGKTVFSRRAEGRKQWWNVKKVERKKITGWLKPFVR